MTEQDDVSDDPRRRSVLKAIAATGLAAQGAGQVAGTLGDRVPESGGDPADGDGRPGEDGPTEITDGGSYWAGLDLTSDAFSAADEPVELHRDDASGSTFRTQLPVEDGTVTFSTAGRPAGEYSLRATGSEDRVDFTLREQEYSVTPDPSRVARCLAPATDLEVTSNRIEYTHVVDSPDVEAETLWSIFGGVGRLEDADGDGANEIVVETDDGTEDVLVAGFGTVDPGVYTIEFTVRDTGVTASAEVEVDEFDSIACIRKAWRSLAVSSVPPGSRLSVTLSVDLEDDYDAVSIRDEYHGPLDGASIESITFDGSEVADEKVTRSEADESGLSVDLNDVAFGTLEVIYSLSVSADATPGSTIGFTGVSGAPDVDAGDLDRDFGTDLATVAESAVEIADEDGDGDIDDWELRSAIVDWSSGRFTDGQLRDIIVEWSG